ncbi:MAG: hypothetical protein JW754_00655 [Candidatus Aenigmarchaeota archaeon]|nr:hypothetical protein [Candidatus Aenigmarchaeota archaeon]
MNEKTMFAFAALILSLVLVAVFAPDASAATCTKYVTEDGRTLTACAEPYEDDLPEGCTRVITEDHRELVKCTVGPGWTDPMPRRKDICKITGKDGNEEFVECQKDPNGTEQMPRWKGNCRKFINENGKEIMICRQCSSPDNCGDGPYLTAKESAVTLPTENAVTIHAEQITTETTTITEMTIEEAMEIAKNSDCVKEGKLTDKYFYNEYTGTWWINMNTKKPGCSPACVVSDKTGTAEINWRCTGALPELYTKGKSEVTPGANIQETPEDEATPRESAGKIMFSFIDVEKVTKVLQGFFAKLFPYAR